MHRRISIRTFFILLLLVPFITRSQQDLPPGPFGSFIPKGWKLIAQAIGDLNGDSIADAALVIQNTDKKNIAIKKGYRADTTDANPRSLLVLFQQPGDRYQLIAKNDSFILPHNDPGMDDPFAGIAIEKENLRINIHLWYKTGSWVSSEHAYVFHYQDKNFALVGVDVMQLNRGGGDTKHYSIDFVYHRYRLMTGNQLDKKIKPETTWKALKPESLKTFASFTKPLTWYLLGLNL